MAALAALATALEQPQDGAAEETEVVAESAIQTPAPAVATARSSEEPQATAARAGPVWADLAAAPGVHAVIEPVAQQPTEEVLTPTAKSVGLPLWQLEVTSGVVTVTLLTATIWTSLRRRRGIG